jgi:hypothetical protein
MNKLIVTLSFLISLICLSSQSWALEAKWFPTDKINCLVWNPEPQPLETVTWSGECSNGKVNGIGILSWSNGDKYIGEYKDGNMHGQGKYAWEKKDQYTGEWQNNNFHGHGTFIYGDGDKYVGKYKNGKFHGKGTYTFANGDVIEGMWENGKKVKLTKT